MLPVAHIAGVPVEETALALAPIAAIAGGMFALHLRDARDRLRRSGRPAGRDEGGPR